MDYIVNSTGSHVLSMEVSSCHSEWKSGSWPFRANSQDCGIHLTNYRKSVNLVCVPHYNRMKLWSWIANQRTWSRLGCSQFSHGTWMGFLLSVTIVRIPLIELVFFIGTTNWNDQCTKPMAYHNLEHMYDSRLEPVSSGLLMCTLLANSNNSYLCIQSCKNRFNVQFQLSFSVGFVTSCCVIM